MSEDSELGVEVEIGVDLSKGDERVYLTKVEWDVGMAAARVVSIHKLAEFGPEPKNEKTIVDLTRKVLKLRKKLAFSVSESNVMTEKDREYLEHLRSLLCGPNKEEGDVGDNE